MMSKNDERKIIDSLANDITVEMKSDDLVQLLNIELSKPESEIDGQLVQEILDALEPSEPDPAQMRAGWLRVKEDLPKRQVRGRGRMRLAQIAAMAAVISIVLVSTIQDAGAFRWTLIQKILKPVAETFGIIIDDRTEDIPVDDESTVYSVSDAPSNLVTYATLDDVPETYEGYIIRPKWLPEGFSFNVGTHFSSHESEIFSLDFLCDSKWFNLNVHITTLDEENMVYSREFERNLEIPIELAVGQHTVTFYNNAEDQFQSAFWIYENAYYMLSGELSVDEITHFVAQME